MDTYDYISNYRCPTVILSQKEKSMRKLVIIAQIAAAVTPASTDLNVEIRRRK